MARERNWEQNKAREWIRQEALRLGYPLLQLSERVILAQTLSRRLTHARPMPFGRSQSGDATRNRAALIQALPKNPVPLVGSARPSNCAQIQSLAAKCPFQIEIGMITLDGLYFGRYYRLRHPRTD